MNDRTRDFLVVETKSANKRLKIAAARAGVAADASAMKTPHVYRGGPKE